MPHTVIVGAGIIGVSTAYYLSHSTSYTEEHAVTIVDQSPAALGASGKAAGFLARSWTGDVTAPLEQLSFQLHQQLSQQYGGEEKWGYRPCQVLAVVGGHQQIAHGVQWSGSQVRAMKSEYFGELDWIKPEVIESKTLLGEPGTFAQCDPYLLTSFLLERAQTKGVKFLQGKVFSLSSKNGKVSEIQILRGNTTLSLPCDNVVLAAGPWTGPLSQVLLGETIPITPYAGHSIVLQPSTRPSADSLFAIVHTQSASYRAEVIPRSSGEVYISGVNSTLDLPLTTTDAIPLDTEIAKLKEIANALLPGYIIRKEQLCFRPMTESGDPFVCAYLKIKGVFIGAGHSHFGIILGPGTGKVLSEMILGEELSADISRLTLGDL